jgi:hypothetical protein
MDVGNALANDLSDTIAVTPPVRRFIIRVRNRDDTYRYVVSERFLIGKAWAPCVKTFKLWTGSLWSRTHFPLYPAS